MGNCFAKPSQKEECLLKKEVAVPDKAAKFLGIPKGTSEKALLIL